MERWGCGAQPMPGGVATRCPIDGRWPAGWPAAPSMGGGRAAASAAPRPGWRAPRRAAAPGRRSRRRMCVGGRHGGYDCRAAVRPPPGRSPCPGVDRAGGGGIAAGAGGDRVGAPARAAAGSLVGGGHRRRPTPPLAVCRRRLRSPQSAGRVAPPPLGWPPPWAARARCWWRRGRGGTRPRPSTPPFAFGWGGVAEWVRGETRTAFCVVFFFCGGGRRDVWMAILTAGSYAFRRSSSLFILFFFFVFDAFLDRAWHAPLRVMAGVWWAQASSCRW